MTADDTEMSEPKSLELFRPVGPRDLAKIRESGYGRSRQSAVHG